MLVYHVQLALIAVIVANSLLYLVGRHVMKLIMSPQSGPLGVRAVWLDRNSEGADSLAAEGGE